MDPVVVDMVSDLWIIVFRLSLVVQDFVQQAYHVLGRRIGYTGMKLSFSSFEMVRIPFNF